MNCKMTNDHSVVGARSTNKSVLLVSQEVMHYRVPVYNYFHKRFQDEGFRFSVITDRLQKQNQRPVKFDLREVAFDFFKYRRLIRESKPAAVILFLHLSDWIRWPMMHWLKVRRIPMATWGKGGNWDAKHSRWRLHVSTYVHAISDALIVYSKECLNLINPRFHSKAFVANNTINFEDFPQVLESKEEIKREFGIPFQKVVLFAGRMGVDKGRKRVDHLIDIFRDLKRSDIGLVLVGSGMSEELRTKLNPRTTVYLGEVHDSRDLSISKLFKMADVCAIPGHVGLGLNQAFFWGLPVVTEECEHPPEIAYLKPGRNGFMVPRNDVAALKEKILFLLDHDKTRAEFSRAAQETLRKEASIEGMFGGFRDCVRFLTKGQMQVCRHDGAPQAEALVG